MQFGKINDCNSSNEEPGISYAANKQNKGNKSESGDGMIYVENLNIYQVQMSSQNPEVDNR